MEFRSQPLNLLARSDWDILLYQKEIFERRWSKKRFFSYKSIRRDGKKLVFDKITDLTWQQSGSPAPVTFGEAKNYIRELNKQRFAKFNDWRFPTLEEVMSLMEREKQNNNLYIASLFDKTQSWIWTADFHWTEKAWYVYFDGGYCQSNYGVGTTNDVRAVRYGQSTI